MDNKPYTIDEEITDTRMERPHVVILGAGASLAATPNGDRNGKQLPLMKNFVETLELAPLLKRHGIPFRKGMNFEALYSRIASKPEYSQAATELESAIYAYFRQLQLPDGPNVYDHLVLSLREKDLIATFNWDPFLYQACYRNRNAAKLPHVVYLHGSVATGYCLDDKTKGFPGSPCSVCKKLFVPSRLLYPVAEKNYSKDGFIGTEWRCLQSYLKGAYLITFFGYGAPKSDTEAVGLMKTAWGAVEKRDLEQTEVIDIRPEDQLSDLWSPFIHSHHYEVHNSFYGSWLARHPRRTCEAAWQQFMEVQFLKNHPFPSGGRLADVQRWIAPMVAAERV